MSAVIANTANVDDGAHAGEDRRLLLAAKCELEQWHAHYHSECAEGCPTLVLVAAIAKHLHTEVAR